MKLIKYLFLLLSTAALGQTASKNFVLSRSYKQTGNHPNDVSKVNIQVQYLDGIGRPAQTVSVGQSPTGSDIVTPIAYDAYGRPQKQYLPYTVNNGNAAFQSSAADNQGSFYTSNTAQLESSDLGRPFAETNLESSPLSRPLGERAPGDKSGSGTVSYGSNGSSEVKRYDYSSGTVSQNGDYQAGTLYRVQTTDENDKTGITFTDINGLTICKRIINGSENLDTYYVYDNLKRLVAVLQPEYQKNASMENFAFRYKYDTRGRLISKNIPGAGRTKMVYDNFDRLVLSQDSSQLGRNVWGFTKYDIMNRPVITGEISSTKNQVTWQASLDSAGAHHENKSSTGIGYTLTSTKPVVTESDVLNVSYFDDYSFPKAANLDYNNIYSVSRVSSAKTRPTGSRTRMLTSLNNWLTSVIYYDGEYRVIQQVRELNGLESGAIERVSTKFKYDLAPVAVEEKTEQVLSVTVTNSLVKVFEYDHTDRLLSVKETITAGSKTKTAYTLAQRYNELGQLRQKWFHAYTANPSKYRRRTDYTQNIRSWQTEGKTYYKRSENGADLPFYGYKLAYANGNNYTNGNISQMLWLAKDEGSYGQGLGFSYDGANRLTSSAGVGGYADTESGITYDLNGNIKSLNRTGSAVDVLTYNYSGNRLTSANDGSGNNSGMKGGNSSYIYDANGNMTSDGNRGATLTYNQLNLPKTVALNGKTFTYEYDATGSKHKYAGDTLTQKYAGAFEYNTSNAMKRVATSEGQLVPSADTLRFDYYLKDHLGNVRLVFSENGAILQKSDYYPFGLEIDRDNPVTAPSARNAVNRYLYNGKEKQLETGFLDYGARQYDPIIGRWMVVDPLMEKYQRLSPYNYVGNNPVNAVDPDGKLIILVNGHWNTIANWLGMSPGAPNKAYWNYFDKNFIGAVTSFFKDQKTDFIDGSSRMGFDLGGWDRFRLGQKWAKKNYENVMAGLADGETIKLVGHSEGSAYAAGIADYFIKRAKKDGKGSIIESMLHLSPDEADEFDNPKEPTTYRIHDILDPVSPAFYYLSGVDYEMITAGYKKVGFNEISQSHGSTVTAGTINRLQGVLNQFIQDPCVQMITNSDGSTTYQRTGQ